MDYVAGTKIDTAGRPAELLLGEPPRRRTSTAAGPRKVSASAGTRSASKPLAYEGCYPSIASPVLAGDKAVYGGLDGAAVRRAAWRAARPGRLRRPSARPISAPGRRLRRPRLFRLRGRLSVRAWARGQTCRCPRRTSELWKIRSPLRGPLADARIRPLHELSPTGATRNVSDQADPAAACSCTGSAATKAPPSTSLPSAAAACIPTRPRARSSPSSRRPAGCSGGGISPASTSRYTTPLYYHERLLVPQAGLDACRLRCLDAATGKLALGGALLRLAKLEPPAAAGGLQEPGDLHVQHGQVRPRRAGRARRCDWLFGHQNVPGFPASHRPLLRAYDLADGQAKSGPGIFPSTATAATTPGICLMDGRLYYSCFFGYSAKLPSGLPGPQGITAAIEPETGKIVWLTTKYSVRGGCTISAKDGRLYLGGYNPLAGSQNCHVWCLDAKDGSLVWQSEPLRGAIHVATIGPQFIFVHAQYKDGYLLDKADRQDPRHAGPRLQVFAVHAWPGRACWVPPWTFTSCPTSGTSVACSAPARGWTPASASAPASPTAGSSTRATAAACRLRCCTVRKLGNAVGRRK